MLDVYYDEDSKEYELKIEISGEINHNNEFDLSSEAKHENKLIALNNMARNIEIMKAYLDDMEMEVKLKLWEGK